MFSTGLAREYARRMGRSAATRGRTAYWLIFIATTGQLLLAVLAPDLPQFEGKAFGSRLIFYPVMMIAPVAAEG
jgi:hypothetical protein